MSGLMIHLMMAYKMNPNGSALYYVGNVAPDAVSDWKNKDITHFRNLEDRREALSHLASQSDPSNEFAEGILMHLFLDWKWDIKARDLFISKTKTDWFPKYREEISKASSYAFHHTRWAKEIWDMMESCDPAEYSAIPGATAQECKDLIVKNYKWHRENKTRRSRAFPPKFIKSFIDKTIEEYTEWKIAYEVKYYNSLPVVFNDFFKVPLFSNGEIDVVCVATKTAVPEKKWVPSYEFEIRQNNQPIGRLSFRVGYNESLYYGGQIGYSIQKPYRGNHYAEKACRLIVPLMRAHGMNKVLITNNITNIASKRTCENLGAKYIRIAPLPEWHELFDDGQRFVNIFEWNL